jgi:hypothetical protein
MSDERYLKWQDYLRKQSALRMNDLDHPPVRLSDQDVAGGNKMATTRVKFSAFERWCNEREEFEAGWERGFGE